MVRRPFLEKISEILTKNSAQKMAFHDLISIEGAVWLKNASRPKIGFEKSKKSRKIVVPEPLVLSIENRLPHGILGVKRVTKR